MSLWVTRSGLVYEYLQTPAKGEKNWIGHSVRVQFSGAHPVAKADGDLAPGKFSYLIGNDSSKWVHRASFYRAVTLHDVYPKTDLRLYFDAKTQCPRYDWIVRPGGNPAQIAMRFDGANDLRRSTAGDVAYGTRFGSVVQRDLVAYTEGSTRGILPQAKFVVDSSTDTVRFSTPGWNGKKTLVIDPVVYSSFVGGNVAETLYGATVTSDGSLYFGGYTGSTNFPTTAGAFQTVNAGSLDALVVKMSPDGSSLTYATLLGGSGQDTSQGIVVDGNGHAFVTGYTNSAKFPVTSGGYQQTYAGGSSDAFVVELAADGSSEVYGTYFGGTGDDAGYSIDIDNQDNAYVCGVSASNDLPVTVGAFQTQYLGGQDSFVIKVNAGGRALGYATYIGGSSFDGLISIKVDGVGDAIVAGATQSSDYPTTAGAFQTTMQGSKDAIVTKLNSTGTALVFSTFLGGTASDAFSALCLNAADNIYLVGSTTSTNYPTTVGAYSTSRAGPQAGTVTELSADGTGLLGSTYLGGSGIEYGTGISLAYPNGTDQPAVVMLGGTTSSTDFPVTIGAAQPVYGGGTSDFFMAEMPLNLKSLTYATYWGGAGNDLANAFAAKGQFGYLVGTTTAATYPTTSGAFQTTISAGTHGAVASIQAIDNLIDHITVGPASRVGGGNATLHLFLRAPAPAHGVDFTIASSDPATANAASTLHIAVGKTQISEQVTTAPVTADTPVTFSASLGYENVSTPFTVSTAVPTKVTLTPTEVTGGTGATVTGKVFLNGTAPTGGAIVTLSSTSPLATVPASVTVPAGQTTATFTITLGGAVSVSHNINIKATRNGVTKLAHLTYDPPTLSTLKLSQYNVVGSSGTVVTGTVTLTGPAPSGGVVVTLSSSDPAATVPASVTVAAGATTATFTVGHTTVATSVAVTITAVNGTVSRSRVLTVNP